MIHGYGVMVALGFLAANWWFGRKAAGIGLSKDEASGLIFWLFGTGIVGARLYYVIWFWKDQFANNPWEALMIHHGGVVFYGGFITGCVTLILWCRIKKQPLAVVADAMAPALALGHAFGRLGCLMNGCCYGQYCDHFWAIHPNSPSEVAGYPLHPTQLYEVFGLLYIFVVLGVLGRLKRYPGRIFWSYCIFYAILRFIVEFYRGDVPHDVMKKFTLAQVVCMGLFLVAWYGSARGAWKARRMERKELRIKN